MSRFADLEGEYVDAYTPRRGKKRAPAKWHLDGREVGVYMERLACTLAGLFWYEGVSFLVRGVL